MRGWNHDVIMSKDGHIDQRGNNRLPGGHDKLPGGGDILNKKDVVR